MIPSLFRRFVSSGGFFADLGRRLQYQNDHREIFSSQEHLSETVDLARLAFEPTGGSDLVERRSLVRKSYQALKMIEAATSRQFGVDHPTTVKLQRTVRSVGGLACSAPALCSISPDASPVIHLDGIHKRLGIDAALLTPSELDELAELLMRSIMGE